MKGSDVRVWVFVFLIGVLTLYYLSGGQINTNVMELWYKFIDAHEAWINHGGWHRIIVVSVWGLIMLLGALLITRKDAGNGKN